MTPMMEQYLKIKQAYKYCLVFFRLGDFYELFFDDAIIASKELDITLTGKDCGEAERAPMCGVPYHSADGYIAKLIEKGHKVAVCEQTEDPKMAKGIVKRDVVRIVTPGTVIDSNSLDAGRNNFIMCIFEDGKGYGLGFADVSTGALFVSSLGKGEKNRINDEIAKHSPSEIISNINFSERNVVEAIFKVKPEVYEPWAFVFDHANKKLCEHFNVHNLNGYGLENDRHGIIAVGALLTYLYETQKTNLSHITAIKKYGKNEFLTMDFSTRRNLELTETMREKAKRGTLLWVLDKTKTPMGARLMRKRIESPVQSVTEINNRLSAVGEYVKDPISREELKELLNTINDIERIMGRIFYKAANGRDLAALKSSFLHIPVIKSQLMGASAVFLQNIYEELDTLSDIYNLIDNAIQDGPPVSIRDGGFIKDGYNKDLDHHRTAKQNGGNWLVELEQRERKETGIKTLKVKYNKVFGYYIEITNSNLQNQNLKELPERYVRRQTLFNCERFTTTELKEIESDILGADEKITAIEYEIFMDIVTKISSEINRIQKATDLIAELDFIVSLAEAADKNGFVRPNINENGILKIKNGRHPVIEQLIKESFITNDLDLDTADNRLAIITGPNMAGKSTYLRQAALITLMAHIGSFVPADSADICITDRIFTRVGASDDLATGQSTFMVEMVEVANILNNATKNSLLILDEIGRGTSTFDGLSIAWAVLEHIASEKTLGAKTLFATHYHELTELEGKVSGVNNYCITVKEQGDEVIFLRKVVRGQADKSYGIQVAGLAGLPRSVINRSREILRKLDEADIAKGTRDLEVGDVNYNDYDYSAQEFGKLIMKELQDIDVDDITPKTAHEILRNLKCRIED